MIDQTPKEVYQAVAEYVGINEPIKRESFKYLKPWIEKYHVLYRVWLWSPPDDDFVAEMSFRGAFSATRSLRGVENILDSQGLEPGDVTVTKFSGSGFDPYEFLKFGARWNASLAADDKKYFRDVIYNNDFQEEIIVTHFIPSTVQIIDLD